MFFTTTVSFRIQAVAPPANARDMCCMLSNVFWVLVAFGVDAFMCTVFAVMQWSSTLAVLKEKAPWVIIPVIHIVRIDV